MILVKRILNLVIVFCAINIVHIITYLKWNTTVEIVLIVFLALYYLKFNIVPIKRKFYTIRLSTMVSGSELINYGLIFLVLQSMLFVVMLFNHGITSIADTVINIIVPLIAIIVILANGLIRVMLTSSQIGMVVKVITFFVWWIPFVNIFFFMKCSRISRREYYFEVSKIELNKQRAENEICKTKYPILLIHGIFWRDWQYFNYWGRIPKELKKNGATLFYGNQHSSVGMEVCGQELKEQILKIIESTKCEKVNIIAHSKGGLDARYVISYLGMSKYVASLTSIGSPHKGSKLVDLAINKLPEKMIQYISKRYNSIFMKLGDREPDFYEGICDLTTKRCEILNQIAPDQEGVLYQSITSQMSSVFSAGFPLNLGYLFLKKSGSNDGFVTIESAEHGQVIGLYQTRRTRGVSHGDMIDLMRENIPGFDVSEVYVDLVKGLKEKEL